jgi:hypothetical protein
MKRKVASQAKWQRRAKKSSKSQNSPCKLSPWIDIVMFLLSTTRLAKSSTNFVPILSPFGNELMKHKPREERDDMHEIQNYGTSQGTQASI